jgi:dinuclear metal center YbgI/SA1388 family protein
LSEVVRVESILNYLNRWAPPDTAEDWDNVGLLVGQADAPVTKVLTALEITPSAVEQAAAMGAELIVSHHPVLFRLIMRLSGSHPVYHIAKHGMSAIAAHTNLDKAPGGVNDGLAARLGLKDVIPIMDGMLRIGNMDVPVSPSDFVGHVVRSLGIPNGGIQWADGGRPVKTVAVCSGAGGDCLDQLPCNIDAFVTGELHYHEWPASPGHTIVAAGHYHTEVMIADLLAKRLADAFPTIRVKAAEEKCPYNIY